MFETFLLGCCIFREKVVEIVLFDGGSSGNELVHEARVCPTAHDLPEKKSTGSNRVNSKLLEEKKPSS